VAGIAKAVGDEQWHVSLAALEVLGAFGGAAAAAIPILVAALKHERTDIRERAAATLGRFGPAARDIIPELYRLLRDKSTKVREAASEATRKIRGDE
jgi:HEAT repeat protein